MASTGRAGRLTALALATGTLIAAGTGTAGAVSTARVLPQLAGTGTGSALHLQINLPVALPGIGDRIDEVISLTDGSATMTSSTINALSNGHIGAGAAPVLSTLLDPYQSHASLDGKSGPASAALLQQTVGPVAIGLLTSKSAVASPTATVNGVLSHSESSVASVKITGLALPAAVTDAVGQVTTVLTGALGSTAAGPGAVTSTVTNTLGALTNATASAPAPVAAAITTVSNTLQSTLGSLTNLNTTLGGLTAANTDLVSIGLLKNQHTISRNNNAITSTVADQVGDINILAGLVKMKAFTSSISSTAAGIPGSAKNTVVMPKTLELSLANGTVTALLDATGLHVTDTVGGLLPTALQNQVNGTLKTVTDLALGVAGVTSDAQSPAQSLASPDGTHASYKTSGLGFTVSPAGLKTANGAPFMHIGFVESATEVRAAIPAVVVPAVTPAAPAALPRTGANLPLTGTVATALLGLAMIVRRRRGALVG